MFLYITEVLDIMFAPKWFYSEIGFILSTVILHRRSRHSSLFYYSNAGFTDLLSDLRRVLWHQYT